VRWNGGLAWGTASVVMDWNMETSCVVNGLAQGIANVMMHWNRETSSVMVYVCVHRGQEVILLSLENKNHIYLIRMPAWR